MRIYREQSLWNFEFWSGARHNAEQLTAEQFDQVESILEDCYPEGIDETLINDLFWFEFETIAEWLGLTLDDAGNLVSE